MIAFGLGMLVSSLIPSSEKERQAVSQLQDNLEPVKEKASEVARDIGESLKPAAQEAAESVRTAAQVRRRERQARGPIGGPDVKRPGPGLKGDGAAAAELSFFVVSGGFTSLRGGSTTSLWVPVFRTPAVGNSV